MDAENIGSATGRSSRIAYLDALRVVSMFAVMVLHLAANGQGTAESGSYEWSVCWGYNLLSRFAVPVFVMISGAVYLDPNRDVTISELLKRRIPKLAGVFFAWSVLYALAEAAKFCVPFSPEYFRLVLLKTISGHYHMWYLYMIMGLYLATPFLRKIAEDQKMLGLFVLFWFLLESLPRLLGQIPGLGDVAKQVTESIDSGVFTGYAGCYCLGAFLYRTEISSKFRKWLFPVSMLLLAAAAAWGIGFGTADALLDVKMPHIVLYSCSVFLHFKENDACFEKSGMIRRVLRSLVSCSLGMYLLHPAVNFLLRRVGIHALTFDPLLWLLPCSALVCGVCYGCIFVIRKASLLRRFV